MLKIQDTIGETLKQWNVASKHKAVIFSAQCPDLTNFFEDEKHIAIFYGFLDQEYSPNNPAQFVAEILDKKGSHGLNQCYGSFIVIYFNKHKKYYLIANDALGDFAVNYTDNQNILHISDLPSALLNNQNSKINHQRVLHYFAISKPQNNASFFDEIKLLNPGHCLNIDQQSQNISPYYKPETTLNFKKTNINSLASEFNTLMQQVIAFQTKDAEKVGVMMSGGMDSTYVAANSKKADKKVYTYTYVFPKMPKANESFWIDALRNQGYNMHTFAGEPHWPLKAPWHVSLNSPYNNPYRPLKSVIYQQAQAQGIKYMLTGVYADHLYIGYIYWLVDQIKRKPFKAIKSLFQTTRDKGFMSCLRQVSPAKFSAQVKFKSPWMNQASQSELNRLQQQKKFKHPHPQQFDLVYGISTAQSSWIENEHAFNHAILARHPFRDRRIVEFLMALPAWVLGDIHNPKRFVRHASKDLLPKSIINRKFISTLEPLFFKGVYHKEFDTVKAILTDSSCQWQNYVQKELVLKILDNPDKKFKESEHLVLWQCVSYELWRQRILALSP